MTLAFLTPDLLDEVTCVYKREYLLTRLYQECQRAKRYRHPVALVLIEVDRFEAWTDAAAAGEGDTLLQEIANTIAGNVREIDLIGRSGDHEFSIILPETGLQAAIIAAGRLRHTIEVELFPWAKALPVTVSAGVAALSEEQNKDADVLMAGAAAALKLAKAQGGNRVGLSPETLFARRP